MKGHFFAGLLFPVLFVLAIIGEEKSTGFGLSAIVYTVLLMIRNEELWPSIRIFFSGVLAVAQVSIGCVHYYHS